MSSSTPLIIPTGFTSSKPNTSRPIIPIQMKKPNGSWSDPIKFNFDTGASWATDVPLQLLKAFGGKVDSDDRKEQPGKIRIPGFNSNQELDIPIVVQDDHHYDLFREQSSRYPLCRVRDLMPYMSIVYEKTKTTLYPKPMALPPELFTTGIITMPQASRRTGTPTSGWYWTKGTVIGPTGKTFVDWFNVNTGDYRFIIKRSTCDKAKLKITGDGKAGNGESNAVGTFRWDETKPVPLQLDGIMVTARDDDEDFARGDDPRNMMGGPNFLNKYKIVIWDLNMAFVPT